MGLFDKGRAWDGEGIPARAVVVQALSEAMAAHVTQAGWVEVLVDQADPARIVI